MRYGRIVLAALFLAATFVLGCVVLGLFGPSHRASADQACTINWAGSSSGGLWATAANWSPARVPTTGDVVCISGVTGTVTFDGTNGTSTSLISELRSSATLSITGGELGLTDTSATGNTVAGFSLSGGSLGDATNDQGSLSDSGSFSWTGGYIEAPTSQGTPAALTDTSATAATIGSVETLSNWNLHFDGALSVTGGVWFQNGGGITEAGTATLDNGADITANGNPSPGSFTLTATGSLTVGTGSSASATLSVPLDSADGSVNLPAGDTLNASGGSTLGSLALGAGGSMVVNGAVSIEAGTDTGTGTLIVEGNVTTIDAALSFSGTIDVNGGELYPAVPGSSLGGLTVIAGTLGDNTNTQQSLTVTGAFSWTGGFIEAPTTELSQPAVTDTSTTVSSTIGSVEVLSNWNLHFDGPLSVTGGAWFQNGGGITEAGTATLDNGTEIVTNGNPTPGDFTLTATGSLTVGAGTSATATAAVPFDASAGTVTVPAGDTLDLGNGGGTSPSIGAFTVNAGATLGLNGVGITTGTNSGAGTVSLSGTVDDIVALKVANVDETGGVTTVNQSLDLSGTLSITGGEMSIASGVTGNTVAGFSLSGGSLGDATNDQGSLSDSGSFSWTGGYIEAPTSQGTPATLTDTSATAATIGSVETLSNWNLHFDGALSVTGGVWFQNGGGITEAGTATLDNGADITANGNPSPGSFTLTATGSLTTSGPGTTGIASVPVVNDGTVTSDGGTLTLGSLANSGTLQLGTGIVLIQSSFAPGAASTIAVTLDGSTVGTSYGQLQISGGTTTLGGTLAVTDHSGFTPANGETFTVTTSSGTSSADFATETQTGEPSGFTFAETTTGSGVTLTAVGPPAALSVDAGNHQSASLETAYPTGLAVEVLGVADAPVPGVRVTFSAPGSGASGTFASGGNCTANASATQCQATTNASGIATASTLTANGTAGAFTVSVTTGAFTPVTFSLTNAPSSGPPPTVTAVIPSAGTTAGGTSVTINGTNLTGATVVDFGAQACTALVVVSATEVTCTTTPETAGTVDVTVTTGSGTSAITAGDKYSFVAPPTPNPYHPLPPARICDTRSGGTRVGCATGATLLAGGTLVVQAEGNGGVPASGVSAVVVNVTVANTTSKSHLTVYPEGETEPTASNLNWAAGQVVPNLVSVGLSPTGAFDATNFAGSTDVIVDVEGYFASGTAGAGLYNALPTPARICDTRPGNPSDLMAGAAQCTGHAPGPGQSLTVQVGGLAGVPTSGLGAVVLNVTAVGAASAGHLTVYPAGTTAPLASNVNFTAGENVPNRVIVPVSDPGGAIEILSSGGTPQILVDVAGWYTDSSNAAAAGTHFTFDSAPTRVCDTRTGLSYTTQCTGHPLAAGVPLAVTVDGIEGIPSGVSAVVLNVTVTNTTAQSHLTVYPAGQTLPTVSDLNWTAGKTEPNFTVATVGSDGQIELDNFAGSTDVIVDVVGWYS